MSLGDTKKIYVNWSQMTAIRADAPPDGYVVMDVSNDATLVFQSPNHVVYVAFIADLQSPTGPMALSEWGCRRTLEEVHLRLKNHRDKPSLLFATFTFLGEPFHINGTDGKPTCGHDVV